MQNVCRASQSVDPLPALDGSKKLYSSNSQQNEGIIEFISKQNYKNEFINPYTLVCSISTS